MRKHCRTRVRSRGKVVLNAYTQMVKYFAYIQPSESAWEDWRFRTLSRRQAEQLVAAGEAYTVTRMVDGNVEIVGYRATQPTSWERPSPATLTMATMKAVVKRQPKVRLTRRECREVEKFMVWPLIGDTKAVAVRPRQYDHERRASIEVLQRGYLQAA